MYSLYVYSTKYTAISTFFSFFIKKKRKKNTKKYIKMYKNHLYKYLCISLFI